MIGLHLTPDSRNKLRILVVGLCPSDRPTIGQRKNATFRNLESWMTQLNVRHFSFINTFDFPGKPNRRNVDYDALRFAVRGYDKILTLGKFVSSVLTEMNVLHYAMPHPSPLNRVLNDRQKIDSIIKECEGYLK